MKTFRCEKCCTPLGEMTKGKIKNGTILLCKECFNKLKLLESAHNLSGKKSDIEMPDFLKNIFGQ